VLRASRLLLVASAAASIGVIAFIESRASAFAPIVLIFAVAAALFVLATVELERDPRRGKLLAVAAALTLASIGTLAGFGSGEVTFPAAGLGVIAAWLAVMWRSARWVWWAFVAYLAAGLLLSAPRLGGLVLLPWLLPSVLMWPISGALPLGGAGIIAIYGAFGLALALAVAAYARPAAFTARPDPRTVVRDAVLAGIAFVGLEALVALARPNTSAWREIVPLAVVIMFVAAALLAAGIRLARSGTMGGMVISVVGAALVIYIATARPTVECSFRGTGTSMGPWWLPYSGWASSGGSSSSGPSRTPQTSSGTITRGDGVTITYTCLAEALVEFEIRR
jgi:hypothetical protein